MDNQNPMTEPELQEEAGILNLACGQLGNELAQGRLQVAHRVYATLGSILKKYAALDQPARAQAARATNGHAEPGQPTLEPSLGR